MIRHDKVLIERMRAMSSPERAQLAWQMGSEERAETWREIDEKFPALDETTRKVKFVELTYGKELADRLAAWFARRGQ